MCVCVCDGEGALSLCAVLAERAMPRSRQPGKSDYSYRRSVSVLNVPKCDGTCSLHTPGRWVINGLVKLEEAWE